MRRLNRKNESHQHVLNLGHQKLSNPDIRRNLCKEGMRNINGNLDCNYSDVSAILVEARNDTMICFNRRTRQSTARLIQARKNYKSTIHETKNKLIK